MDQDAAKQKYQAELFYTEKYNQYNIKLEMDNALTDLDFILILQSIRIPLNANQYKQCSDI